MDWYYSDGKTQFGPVNDAEFERLRNDGTITFQTLVWNQTMPNWLPWGQVNPMPTAPAGVGPASAVPTWGAPAGQQACSVCGRNFPEADLLKYESDQICAECKPAYFQRMREGAVLKGEMIFAGFWIRFGASFIDGIITQILSSVIGGIAGFVIGDIDFGNSSDPSALIAFMSFTIVVPLFMVLLYHVYFVGKFGATPGKMALKIKVVRADGEPVGFGLAFGRYFGYILSGLPLGLGYIMAAFDDEKRALHDRICNTRVIRVV